MAASAMTLRWDHRQEFSLSTSLNLSFNYASNNAVIRQNAIDPLQNTQQITSSLNYSKRFSWGTLTLGGNRRQSITDGSVQQLFPAVTLSPVPIAVGTDITWSPGLSFTNNTTSKQPLPVFTRVLPGGIVDTVARTADTRVTAFSFDTPIRFGSFNWANSVDITDQMGTAPDSVGFRIPNTATPDPNDSLSVSQLTNGSFQSSIDWDTGINLPILFRGSWKLQPVVGIANTTTGAFAIRNRNTNGNFVRQGKRFRFGVTAAPTFFGFLPGLGPLARIRHSLSPIITWNYQPAATIPLEYARAIAVNGQPVELRSDATQAVSLSLSQTFEGKRKPPKGDTASVNDTKIRLLSISTSPISYDFEQAKKPGRTGWATQSVTNSLLSDLLPGFNLSLTHDLFRGTVGSDTAKFDPFLQNVSASFAVSGNTFRAIGSIFGLGGKEGGGKGRKEEVPTSYVAQSGRRTRPGSFFSTTQAPLARGGRGFSANFNYSLSRTRPLAGITTASLDDRQSLGFSTNFSPTPFWSLSWSSQYNITDGQFESQVVRLERDLHEWRAGVQLRAQSERQLRLLFFDLPDRSAGAQVRLRSDDVRELVSSRRDAGRQRILYLAVPHCYELSKRISWHGLCFSAEPSSPETIVCAGGGSQRRCSPRRLAQTTTAGSGPGTTPDTPTTLSSISLDGAIALTWSDNAYLADPSNFQNYRVYSTTYDIDAATPVCGTSFRLEGTTVCPGIRRRGTGQRCPALLHGHRGEPGRFRERPLPPPRRHSAARRAQRGHLRAPDPDCRERFPVLGRSQQ